MADWASKTCGNANCGFVASGDAVLEKFTCAVCSTDMCAKCYGGKPTGAEGEMCYSCAMKLPAAIEHCKKAGI